MSASAWNPSGSVVSITGITIQTQEFTATASQTHFALSTYTFVPGTQQLQVSINGAWLDPALVTEDIAGTGFTIAAQALNNKVTARIFKPTTDSFQALANSSEASASAAHASELACQSIYNSINGITGTVIGSGDLTFLGTGQKLQGGTSSTIAGFGYSLASNTLSGTTSQFNTALSDNDFATQAGTETLANKTALAATNNIEARSAPNSSPFGFRNKINNGGFSVNQRVYVSGAAVGSGLYGHDRWKMAASGDTYTFSTTANKTTITIPAGKVLQQVIEGINLQSTTYTLSWEGTAQGKIGAGAYGASGITGAVTGGTNTTIEFGPGTVSNVMFAEGSVATPFEMPPYAYELQMCQRYYQTVRSFNGILGTAVALYRMNAKLTVPMRIVPTATLSGGMAGYAAAGGSVTMTALGTQYTTTDVFEFDATINSVAYTSGVPVVIYAQNSNYVALSAEL